MLGNASSTGPSKVSIDAILVLRPDGSTTTSSPGFITPPATVPAYARRRSCHCGSCGRSTYCTGNRTSIRLRSEAMCTSSRWCSSDVPSYQGELADRSTTLSPLRADTGMVVRSAMSSLAAKLRNSVRISSKRSSDQSTRSILLMHSTRCGTRSSEAKKACRRDCSSTPLRASTRIRATLAVDAPVTMFRVYCTCPGCRR